jgi:tetratricopeptide (TPR) repeat protein
VDHPTPETLRAFVLARLDRPKDAQVEAHLAAGCEPCLFAARELFPEAHFGTQESVQAFVNALYEKEDEASAGSADADEELDRVLHQALRRRFILDCEAALTPTLLGELDRRPPVERRATIRTAPRYRLYGFAEQLCELSREAGFSDVARALELAELAVEVSDGLDPRLYFPRITADQQGLARAFLGNARRVASDLFGADRAFHEGRQFLREGTESPILHAEFSSLLSSLRIDQARYPEARRMLEEAREIFEQWGHPEDVVRVLIQLEICTGHAGEVETAVRLCAQALEALKPVEDKRLHLAVHHDLTWWTVDLGDGLEALARFQQAQPLYERFAEDPWVQLRRRWLEGRIHAVLGDHDVARRAFEEVREQASRRELAFEFAMVSLELALVHLREGDIGRVQDLAEEMTPIFRSQDLHRYALAALYLFRHDARSQRITTGLLREILSYLRRARNNPFLHFEPTARWG